MRRSHDVDHLRKILFTYPKKAINILYERHYHGLVALSYEFTQDKSASEDIVQEVLATIWERHNEIGKPHQMRLISLVMKMVKYRSIDFCRRRARVEKHLDRLQYHHGRDTEESFQSTIIRGEQNAMLWNLIDSFPRRERECLNLCYEHDLSLDETAERLNISRKSVERSLTSAKKRLISIGKRAIGID